MRSDLLSIWKAQGFETPSDIQAKSYDPIQAGENVVLQAPTGSGKTLAFLIPTLEIIEKAQGLQVMIVLPSQELASQVGEVVKTWADALGLKTAKLIGGANVKRQIETLKKGPEIVVGTLGRLDELMASKKLKPHRLKTLIIDEADVLFDAEHRDLTEAILKKVPKKRQTILASATMPEDSAAFTFETETPLVWLSSDLADKEKVQYLYLETSVRKRDDILRQLAHVEGMQALVFVRTVADIEKLYQKLSYHHIKVGFLHRDMSGQKRQQFLSAFKQGKLTYLLTTDVAARGIDVPDLPYVIEYDASQDAEQYIHRSGRTGRMGNAGTVISLVNDRGVRSLQQVIGRKLDPIVLYHGELMSKDARDSYREIQDGTPESIVTEAKPKAMEKKKDKPSPPEKKAKKHKKRKKAQKNKGARRKKG